jgi:hypothetical protein
MIIATAAYQIPHHDPSQDKLAELFAHFVELVPTVGPELTG